MNFQNLTPGKYASLSSLRDRIGNAYEQIAAGADYKRNDNQLRIIQVAVVVVAKASANSRAASAASA